MALSAKAKDGLVVVDNLELTDAKTKALAGQLAKAGFGKKVLVIDGDAVNESFARAAAQPRRHQRAPGDRRQRLRHPEA